MIRRLTAALLIITSVLAMRAETHYVPHISVGVHGGASGARVSFSPQILQKWELGPAFGVSIRYSEEKLVGILAELNYEQRGWSEDYEEAPLNYHRSLGYLNLPIMTHVNFGSSRARCFFNLGPEFALLVGQSTRANYDYTNPQSDPNWPKSSRMTAQLTKEVQNTFDYGICGGVGCEYYLQPRHSVYIEARYYFGLGNIFSAHKGETFGASRNMSIAVTVGYNFRLY